MIFPGFSSQNSCWDAVSPGSYLSHFTHFWHLGLRFDPSFLFFFTVSVYQTCDSRGARSPQHSWEAAFYPSFHCFETKLIV